MSASMIGPDSSAKPGPGWLTATLKSCWSAGDVTPELAAEYRGRQFHATAMQLPIGGVGNVLCTSTVAVAFWNRTDNGVLLAWALAQLALMLVNLWCWRGRRKLPQNTPMSARALWLFAADLATIALLYAGMTVYLFRTADEHGHLVLTAIATAFIATGSWLFAAVPQAGLAWALILCVGTAAGLASPPGSHYGYLAGLLGFYAIVMVASVLGTSRRFLAGLKAETELEKQRQLVDLLLNDFEESASDWLWETDRRGALSHVSARLGEAIGRNPGDLQGQSLIAIISSGFARPSATESAMVQIFSDRLQTDAPFRDVVVPVRVDGQPRWWSMTAKPLRDVQGRPVGWRGVGSDITAVREREAQISRLANQDMLTALANRHQFSNRLEQYFRHPGQPTPCTLFLLDLDNFKTVNDSLGHAAGDHLLQEVARRLGAGVRPSELLARLGGDEFAIVVPGALSRESAEEYGKGLLQSLNTPWVFSGHRVHIRASIGVACAPYDGSTAAELLKASDMALYAAKAAGRHTVRFYGSHMDAQSQRKLSLLNDLGDGLERQEFQVHYQPQLDLATGELVGFEALVRWRHPVKGSVAPDDFISVAEESGLIMPLGAWVLEQACTDAMQWPAPIKVAVNVSWAQFANSDVLAVIEQALQESGLPGSRLEVELTESTLMQDAPMTLEVLQALKAMGVSIALDDFGTGYSCLSYLRSFPLDKLKIDRSFVAALDRGQADDADASAIVQAIVQLAQALHLETIAEGAETAAQRAILERIGCTQIQGHLIAKPLDCAEVEAFLESWSPSGERVAAGAKRMRAPLAPTMLMRN